MKQIIKLLTSLSNVRRPKKGKLTWRSLFPFKSNIYFMYPYCDTLYVIEKNKYIKRLYYVNYGNNKIPANLLKANDDLYSWDKKLLNLGDYMHTTAIGYTDNYIYISSVNKAYQGFFTLYSKKNKHTLTAHTLIDDMFLKGNTIPIKGSKNAHDMDKNSILWAIDPEYLINGYKHYMSYLSETGREEFRKKYPGLVKICTTLKEDDNPVILRIKVKDF